MQTHQRFAGRLLGLGLILLVAEPLLAQTDAKRPDAPYHTLLLANGELLEGFVAREVDTIVVTTKRGATLRLPDKEILHFSRDTADAFQFLRRAADLNDSDQVVKLAEWALQNRLYAECDFELDRASQIDAAHASLPSLRERLRHAQGHSPPPKRKLRTEPASSIAKPVPQLRTSDLTLSERRSLAVFTKHLQPMLVNQCATAGCHGRAIHTAESDNAYLIHRPIRGRGFTSAQSIANLKATLRFVDTSNPSASRLIATLRQADVHANFLNSRQQITMRQIERWLATFPVVKQSAVAVSQRSTTPATAPNSADALAKAITTPPQEVQDSPTSHIPTAGQATSTNRDPYDPDVFNRLNDSAAD